MQRGGLRFLYPKIRITLRKNRRKIKYFGASVAWVGK